MKLAIIHDDFMQFGGAERLVFEISKIWSHAPIFTACFDPRVLPKEFPHNRLVPSFIQRIPFQKKLYRQLFFLHPLAFEQFDLNEYDLVISSTTRFAKSVVTQPNTTHLCYCNTPPRFLWRAAEYFSTRKLPPVLSSIYKLFLNPLFSYLRLHDYVAAQQVDLFIANSKNVAGRIQKIYRQKSKVVYPFVDLARFNNHRKRQTFNGAYFLIVARLGSHKRLDLAVEAFNHLQWPLKIIGDGPERKNLQAKARRNIEFLGRLPDEKVVEYYYNCQAFIYPQEEDFGITALEAQAAGKPVIAYQAGGALETVIEGKTGFFFQPQTAKALIARLLKLKTARAIEKIRPQDCKENAKEFSRERFIREIQETVKKAVGVATTEQ